MHSTSKTRDGPREGLIDRGIVQPTSGGCLEGVLTKEPLRLLYQAVRGRGPTEGFTSLIVDEVKTGE
jgi:hypothetical protein